MTILAEAEWTARAAAHRDRVTPWVQPRLERRARGHKHPVDDFLFEYYSFRPGRLLQWHPGLGIVLAGDAARDYLAHPGYAATPDGVTATPALTEARLRALFRVIDLLDRTAAREPRWGCFALHEWAMVYRLAPDDVRHPAWPLRLGAEATDDIVRTLPLRCTHYDAVRFFTADALPLNETRPVPTRERQLELEQPGCLHATMDLYRWTAMFDVLVGSDPWPTAFAVAREVRALDMAASVRPGRARCRTGAGRDPRGSGRVRDRPRAIAEQGQRLRAWRAALVAIPQPSSRAPDAPDQASGTPQGYSPLLPHPLADAERQQSSGRRCRDLRP
jgi:hypothetical protein